MKVKELQKILSEINQEYEVVVSVGFEALEHKEKAEKYLSSIVNLGWQNLDSRFIKVTKPGIVKLGITEPV